MREVEVPKNYAWREGGEEKKNEIINWTIDIGHLRMLSDIKTLFIAKHMTAFSVAISLAPAISSKWNEITSN